MSKSILTVDIKASELDEFKRLADVCSDMYRALRAIIHACDDEQEYQAYKMAVEALAKADGEV